MTDLPAHIDIRDVSLRDGLQIEDPIPLAAKLELLAAVAATGVREMEATAFVSPSKVPALADAAEVAAELHRFAGIEFSALVASPNGAKRAIAAGLHSIEYVVSAADGHSRSNVGPHHRRGDRADRRDRRRSPTTAAPWSRSSSPRRGTARSTGRRRRSAWSRSWMRHATPAPTGLRSPTPSGPPRRGGSAI